MYVCVCVFSCNHRKVLVRKPVDVQSGQAHADQTSVSGQSAVRQRRQHHVDIERRVQVTGITIAQACTVQVYSQY